MKKKTMLNSIIQQYYTKSDYWMALLEKEGEREGEQISMISHTLTPEKLRKGSC